MIEAGYIKAPVRILIVDDNRDFASAIADLARLQALEPTVVTSLAQALAAVRERSFEVAIVDHLLHDGKGTDFLAAVRDEQPDLVTVFVTAFVSSDTTVRALNEGAFAFVTKDSEPEAFVDAIKRAVQNAILRRENRRLRETQEGILGAIPDQLLLVDEKLVVISANRRIELFFPAAAPADQLPCPLSDLLDAAVLRRFDWAETIARAFAGEEFESTLTVREPTGAIRNFGVRCIPVVRAPMRLVLVRISDLSERIQLEQRLSASEGLATVGRLVAIIAHEIRNPLTGIRALAQILQKSRGAETEDRESIDEILSLTDRMVATLADLLTYARPPEWREENIPMVALAEDLVQEGRRWPSCEGRTLALETNGNSDLIVVGQRDRLFSAFSNLIDNALQAAPEGGDVLVVLHREGADCVLAVEDSGFGIAEEDRARLFDPFFTRRVGGTGLGLSIVKTVVDGHGGAVEVGRSRILGGAAFRVRLPLARAGQGQIGDG